VHQRDGTEDGEEPFQIDGAPLEVIKQYIEQQKHGRYYKSRVLLVLMVNY
jgi:hypothetical protein